MKKLGILCAALLCVFLTAQAIDINKKDWHQGEIILSNGDKLTGKVQYDLKQNVAIIKYDGKMQAYSAFKVDYFKIIDRKRRTLRSFYTMPFRNQKGIERLMFFELIFEDNFAIFNREHKARKEHAMLSEIPFVEEKEAEEEVTIFTYYVFTPDGNFRKVLTEKSDLVKKLSLNRSEKKNLENFIYENDLNLTNRSDFIRVIYEFV
jgi:hypothetical protein